MLTKIKKLYDWMGSRVHSPYAGLILGFLFFLEAIFFLPTDPMLILYCIHQQKNAFYYATIATFSSVLGGITAYFIGFTIWHVAGEHIIHNRMVNYIVSPSMFAYFAEQYRQHEWWAILAAGFTPIPYKAATLTAGFCKISFMPFVICSIIARGARFFLLAGVISIFGEHIRGSIDRYFNIIVILTTLAIVCSVWWFM